MESKIAVLDTGALIAFLSREDHYHLWAQATFKKLPSTLVSCEAVISEVCFLLQRDKSALHVMLNFLRSQVVKLLSLVGETNIISSLMEKYSNVPMSYADACLVRIAEIQPGSVVVTTDSDFLTYRIKRNQRIPAVVAPEKRSIPRG